MKRWPLLLVLLLCSPSFGETEQPPFETPDPAIAENFRQIYYAFDELNRDAARYLQVKIIQVVSASTNTSFITTSASFVDSNLSATITPTNSSNKIVVFVSGQGTAVVPATVGYFTLERGSTNLGDSTVGFRAISFPNYPVNTSVSIPISFSYVDSPATTSATTYTVQVRSTSGGNNVVFGASSSPQSIILMEVNEL